MTAFILNCVKFLLEAALAASEAYFAAISAFPAAAAAVAESLLDDAAAARRSAMAAWAEVASAAAASRLSVAAFTADDVNDAAAFLSPRAAAAAALPASVAAVAIRGSGSNQMSRARPIKFYLETYGARPILCIAMQTGNYLQPLRLPMLKLMLSLRHPRRLRQLQPRLQLQQQML
jgi:hypothetical protein